MYLGLIRVASLESAPADGKTRTEDESVWYVKDIDLEKVRNLAIGSELQEQYHIPATNGTVRVRRIDGGSCIQTTKSWVPGEKGKKECEIEVPTAMFDMFADICPNGMIKRRFKIPTTEATEGDAPVLEIDIYFENHIPDGEPAAWCKIDYEYGALPEGYEWPFEFEEIVVDNPHNRTEELKTKVSEIMDNYLIKKNSA